MNKGKAILIAVAVITYGVMSTVMNLSRENRQLKAEIQGLKEDPQKIAKEETARVVALVGKLVILPADEEPVLATVTDKEKLKDQPLFAKAENGDKVLIYSKAQKAYVYNSVKNVLVDIVPINIGETQIAITGVSDSNPIRLVLVNGTKTTGLTSVLEQRIKDRKIAGVSILGKATAKTTEYQKTQVVDISGKWGTQAREVAQLVGGEAATESAEIWPATADLMIIVGADFK